MKFSEVLRKYIAEHSALIKPIAIAAVGILLIIISMGGSGGETDSYAEDDLTKEVREFCEAIDGVGECKVMIYYKNEAYSRSDEKTVDSVVIVCRGADSVEIRKSLTEMLSSLFGIGANRIRIEKMA